jgi:putative membrane protein insertion efficiency factor
MTPPGPGLAATMLIGAVRTYQYTLRAVIGAHCRFEPSCSHYACAVLASHGALRGTALAARRILRCNPWHQGGLDLPPPAPSRQAGTPA